jgi:predicted DNA-binding transcriptional regulator YafY
MSFDKAEQLLELREMVASRRLGVTLDEVVERFGISLRTAQRMLAKLETKFGEVASGLCADGRKRWRIDPAAGVDAREPLTFAAEDLAALGRAIAAAQREGATAEARSLERVRDKLVALIPGRRLSRIEPDLEALLEAQGVVARPGPRPKLDEAVSQAIAHATAGTGGTRRPVLTSGASRLWLDWYVSDRSFRGGRSNVEGV